MNDDLVGRDRDAVIGLSEAATHPENHVCVGDEVGGLFGFGDRTRT